MKHIAAIVMAMTTMVSLAEPTSREAEIENESPKELANLKGKTVVVEGMLWGSGWPGLGERVVLATGQRIYFTGTSTGDTVPDGKPARIHGKLSLRHWRAGKRGEAGYRNGFDYWTIDNPVFEAIERVTSDDVTQFADHLDKNKPIQTEQGGADQPATAPESKSKGKDNPQPESKVAPR
jgi:hypothetical protein